MASIRKEMRLDAAPDTVWNAIRDVGSVHRSLAAGFVTDCRLEDAGGARVVTFANGLTARELIVDIDDGARRLVWAVVEGRPKHHNASLQVFAAAGKSSRIVWIADLLPNDLAEPIASMMEQGMRAIEHTLEGRGDAGAAA
ncbi:MAG TPA: SRPBCC family protein [Hyphomicrobiaceae bacterium]|nr:SRPBCC family protein [Hyphomicrobiaceae bacterium]